MCKGNGVQLRVELSLLLVQISSSENVVVDKQLNYETQDFVTGDCGICIQIVPTAHFACVTLRDRYLTIRLRARVF